MAESLERDSKFQTHNDLTGLGASIHVDIVGDFNTLMKEQSVHIQGYSKDPETNTMKEVVDCSGEIYTASGLTGTAGHCALPTGLDKIDVTTSAGQKLDGQVVSIDRPNDLALIKVNPNGIPLQDIPLAKLMNAADPAPYSDVTGTAFPLGTNTPKEVKGTLDLPLLLRQFVAVEKMSLGQDPNMDVQRIFGDFKKGDSGALLRDKLTNKPLGILDYANKSNEAVMIPFDKMFSLLMRYNKQQNSLTKKSNDEVG